MTTTWEQLLYHATVQDFMKRVNVVGVKAEKARLVTPCQAATQTTPDPTQISWTWCITAQGVGYGICRKTMSISYEWRQKIVVW